MMSFLLASRRGLGGGEEKCEMGDHGAYMESLAAYFAVATLRTCVSWAVLSCGRHRMWMISSSGSLRPFTSGKRSCRHSHVCLKHKEARLRH